MTYGFEFSGPLAALVLHLPLAALIVVVLLATRPTVAAPRHGGGAAAAGVGGVGRYGAPLAAKEGRAARTAAPGGVESPAVSAQEKELAALESRLSAAAMRGDERELVDLHLAMAGKKRECGRSEEAADSLRKAVRIAARLGNREAQAQARLELGDLARASGDLTTACEHWQLARGLFFDLKRPRELEEAETRMRKHGCPTDWVLNDF